MALFWKKHYAKDQKSIPDFRPCQRDVRGSSTPNIYIGKVMSYIILSVLLPDLILLQLFPTQNRCGGYLLNKVVLFFFIFGLFGVLIAILSFFGVKNLKRPKQPLKCKKYKK